MHTIECNTCGHHMEGTDEAAVVIELQWHLEWAHEPAELVTFTYRSPEYRSPEHAAQVAERMRDLDWHEDATSPTGWSNDDGRWADEDDIADAMEGCGGPRMNRVE